MHNSYGVIESDNYVIFNKLQNFHFREYFYFIFYQVHVNPNVIRYLKHILFWSQNISILNGRLQKVVVVFFQINSWIFNKFFSKLLLILDGYCVFILNPDRQCFMI